MASGVVKSPVTDIVTFPKVGPLICFLFQYAGSTVQVHALNFRLRKLGVTLINKSSFIGMVTCVLTGGK